MHFMTKLEYELVKCLVTPRSGKRRKHVHDNTKKDFIRTTLKRL